MATYEVQARAIYTNLLPLFGAIIRSKARNRRKESAVAKEAVNIVLERTADGIDVSGRRFAPYSAGYAKFKRGLTSALKRAAGKRKNTGVGKEFPAWLRATGHMLRSLSADVESDVTLRGLRLTIKFRIRDNEAAEIARYHNETGAGKSRVKREFMGLSRQGTFRRSNEERRLLRAWKNG